MDEYRKKLKELSDKAFEDEDYKTLKELRYEILQYDKEHSSPPKKEQTPEGFEALSYEEQLTFSMEEARKAHDIYSMLVIDDKMKELKKERKIPPMAKQE